MHCVRSDYFMINLGLYSLPVFAICDTMACCQWCCQFLDFTSRPRGPWFHNQSMGGTVICTTMEEIQSVIVINQRTRLYSCDYAEYRVL